MIIFSYDKTLDGLLCVIYEAYQRKIFPEMLIQSGEIPPLFVDQLLEIQTRDEIVSKTWGYLEKKMPKESINMMHAVWLSEQNERDWLLYKYIKKAIDSRFTGHTDFRDEVVISINDLAKKVYKEGYNWKQFVRFKKSKDGIYFAPVYPIYNSLPLAIPHFKNRFSSQPWIIYDLNRDYGFYYDTKKVIQMTLERDNEYFNSKKINENLLDPKEILFQESWKKYYQALTIKERINLKQQKQHMPKRYWQYLTEMQ
ncbi:probable DNA metabolism protein [Apibacter mensalis]|uniref:Probable DNA metabolism protein n=1 Tax=Apibacter mensalis TaxID=1586267 RepID=A0A0X3AML1_9FLAO|nr:TIGR03915 family putative DNA repair protein [Apibacter mensalis]CVK15275.1 probable DNA metabolism protein [Apibacter mensalis]